ncbi:sphingosine-1-phosphate lyase 1-like [Babylonia areolata]|uniref:sphingosine-1-phosphate lyase 1-like n=1 Tax=Babylonia areolata TaxID=304850 RepID=UPI003FD124FF
MSDVIKTALSPLTPVLQSCKSFVNSVCKDLEPWQIVLYTCGTTVVVLSLRDFLFHEDETLKKRTVRGFFRLVKKIPYVQRKIEAEMSKARAEINDSMNKAVCGTLYIQRLPAEGLSESELMEQLQRYKKLASDDWQDGKVSGTVYNGEDKLTQLMAKTYGMFAWTNPLHPDVFPDIRKMEAEVVRMCCGMFNGDSMTSGSVTSGGTESIMLACLAYRSLARERGVKIPEMIVPHTAHAAFDKAAEFFHMKITHIPVDPETRKVDIKAMKRAISGKTCMLVASAPAFPHGIIDDVQAVAALGEKYNIPVHVDCCLGGFLVPFMDKAGYPVDPFDFRLPGVTSISADTHKYGYAPKGSSVILYRNRNLHRRQFFVQPDWTGGIYASPTMAGSRAGAVIAACWATLMYFGQKGYVESTRSICATTRYIAQELGKIEGIVIFGEPKVNVVGIGSDRFNVFRLFEMLVEKKWILNSLQFPSSIHLCVTKPTTKEGVADQFIADVKDSVAEIMKNPTADCGGAGAIYGMAQSIPDRTLVNEIAGCFLEACYNTTNTPAAECTPNGEHVANGLPNGAAN